MRVQEGIYIYIRHPMFSLSGPSGFLLLLLVLSCGECNIIYIICIDLSIDLFDLCVVCL